MCYCVLLCIVLLCIVVHWCVLLCIGVSWCVLLCIVVHCCTLLCIVVHCIVVLEVQQILCRNFISSNYLLLDTLNHMKDCTAKSPCISHAHLVFVELTLMVFLYIVYISRFDVLSALVRSHCFSDGSKMSKRKKNYPEPTLIVNKYGADACRCVYSVALHLVSS